MTKLIIKFLCFLFIITIFSCSASLPELTPSQIEWASNRWPQTNISMLQEGKRIYIDKCSGCHGVKNPIHYTPIQWDSIMVKMGKKAKLNKVEYDMVSHYVITMSKK